MMSFHEERGQSTDTVSVEVVMASPVDAVAVAEPDEPDDGVGLV
jgi:hypothetical protein